MSISQLDRGDGRPSGSLRRFVSAAMAPGAQRFYLQLFAAGAVGSLLGLFVSIALGLPPSWRYLALVAATIPFVLMIVGKIRRVLLAITIMDVPLQIGIHFGYRDDVASLGAIGGIGVSATTFALIGLYAIWIADVLANRRPARPPVLRWSLPLALYVGVVLIATAAAYDSQLAMNEAVLVIETFLLFVYVASNVRTRGDLLFMVTMLLVALLLEALVVLGTGLTGREIALAGIRAGSETGAGLGGGFSRAVGTFGSPNVVAAYLSMLIPLGVAVLIAGSRDVPRRLAAAGVFFGLLALFFTFSRGGWMAFIVSIAVMCVLLWRRGWLSPAIPLGIVAVTVLPALLFQDAVISRITAEEAAMGRVPLMTIALRMFESSPVLGVGPNNFALAMDYFITPEIANAWIYTVHNKYLLVLSETGIVGLSAFLLFLVAILYHGWKGWRSKDRVIAILALGLTAAVVGHMAHMMVEIFNRWPMVQTLWLSAALLIALNKLEDDPWR